MNTYCNGEYFRTNENRYYRCFWDGKILKISDIKDNICPNCNREIDGAKVHPKKCTVIHKRFVSPIDAHWEGELPK